MDNINETVEAVARSARTHMNPGVRIIDSEEKMPYGKYIRQGDVYIRRMPLDTDYGELTPGNMQLVPGQSMGSKHVCRGDRGERVFDRKGDVLTGPVVDAPNGFYLQHPKHGDFDITVPGKFEVTYPRDLGEEELARVRD